ncbi:MAG TPA: sigma factor-like helix-turn-helix DNA-binding protein [Isosphaeraceae bacterium]|nr:sigma factor-like helix-turn-helix DNA-binding protein [Isosphaeraceae bacterium]
MMTARDGPTTDIHWIFQDCDEPRRERARRAWAEGWPRLERWLTTFPREQRRLLLTVRHDDRTARDEVRAVLILPAGTLVAEESADDAAVALKRVARTLGEEIKRHKDRLRHEHLEQRKSRRREVLGAAGPLLQRDAELGRSQAFFELLRPLLGTLRDHARRELRIAELEGGLPTGQVTEDDLMDEVLLRAWRQFPHRPRWVALDLWLLGLLHQALGEWGEGVPPAPAESTRRPGDEEEWFAPLFGEEEPLGWEDLLPADEDDPASRLEAEEERERALALLSQLPLVQRRAFALRVLEGYEADDIAKIQGRPESEVLADIEAARRVLLAGLKERGEAAGNE